MKVIFIQDIDLKGSPCVRSHIREEVVGEYADIYRKGKIKMPPVVLFTEDDKSFLLGDGAHRTYALLSLKCKTVEADVRKGNHEEALRFALTANERHGIRRTHEDKRFAVREAIKQWPKCSDSQVAAICAVDKNTVTKMRVEMEKKKEVKNEPVRVAKDGREMPASAKTAPVKSPVELKDRVGTVIPQFAMKFWERSDEVDELMATLNLLHKFLTVTQNKEDLMYGEVNFSAAILDLEKVQNNLACAIPYAVCTTCQGQPKTQPKGECRMCKGRGVISRFRWNTLVPSEIKKMKEKKV